MAELPSSSRTSSSSAATEWRRLVAESAECRNCDLWRNATQTVFGEGPLTADAVFVGEQPGDQEDRQGAPFVGPAGRVLDEGLEQAGIERGRVYVTNAVKHFKWTPRGKRRIHQKPNREEVRACAPWLDAEFEVLQPRLVVLLGATAAQAVLGSSFRVTAQRGQLLDSALAPNVMATVHPSSILRGDPTHRADAMAAFVDDLRVAASVLHDGAAQ
ncbi:MAG TPA: UdgX family uracil-DNA binding protein [Acidimicrobiales bacterium]